jgi:hypothetical protein
MVTVGKQTNQSNEYGRHSWTLAIHFSRKSTVLEFCLLVLTTSCVFMKLRPFFKSLMRTPNLMGWLLRPFVVLERYPTELYLRTS